MGDVGKEDYPFVLLGGEPEATPSETDESYKELRAEAKGKRGVTLSTTALEEAKTHLLEDPEDGSLHSTWSACVRRANSLKAMVKVLRFQVVLTADERDQAVQSFLSQPSHLAILGVISTFNLQSDTPGQRSLVKIKQAVANLSPLLAEGLARWPQEYVHSVGELFRDTLPQVLSLLHGQPVFQTFVLTTEQEELLAKLDTFEKMSNEGKARSRDAALYLGPWEELDDKLQTHMQGQIKIRDDYIARCKLLEDAADSVLKDAEGKEEKARDDLKQLRDQARGISGRALFEMKQQVAEAEKVGGTYMIETLGQSFADGLLLELRESRRSIVGMEDKVRCCDNVCSLTKAWADALLELTPDLKAGTSKALAKQHSSYQRLSNKLARFDKALVKEIERDDRARVEKRARMELEFSQSSEERSAKRAKRTEAPTDSGRWCSIM